jgi:RHS repeat-associated protein
MFPSTKNTTPFWYPPKPNSEGILSHPFGSYPKPQIFDLVVLAAYPFGSILSSVSKGVYRYGFNGQEQDNEIKGSGNSLNYTFRMYDPRIGRFFAVDPIAAEYPELTPYQFASNSPIINVELEGLEGGNSNSVFANRYAGVGLTLTLSGDKKIFSKVQLTGGFRQDFSRIGGMDVLGNAGTFGITPRIEFKGTADLHPSFAFRGYVKLNANLSTPLGAFSGELKAGPDKYSATISHPSGVAGHKKFTESQKSLVPTMEDPIDWKTGNKDLDDAKSSFKTALGLSSPIKLSAGKPPIPLQNGYKPPMSLGNDFLLPGMPTFQSGGQNSGIDFDVPSSPNGGNNNQIGPVQEDGTF